MQPLCFSQGNTELQLPMRVIPPVSIISDQYALRKDFLQHNDPGTRRRSHHPLVTGLKCMYNFESPFVIGVLGGSRIRCTFLPI